MVKFFGGRGYYPGGRFKKDSPQFCMITKKFVLVHLWSIRSAVRVGKVDEALIFAHKVLCFSTTRTNLVIGYHFTITLEFMHEEIHVPNMDDQCMERPCIFGECPS